MGGLPACTVFNDAVVPDASAESAAYKNAVLEDRPRAYFRLDESSLPEAKDATGTYKARYVAGCTLDVPGAFTGSSAVLLDGKTGYVLVDKDDFGFADDFSASQGERPGCLSIGA